MEKRRSFNQKVDGVDKIVKSAGILLWSLKDGQPVFLMVNYRWKDISHWGCLGGKSEPQDKSPLDIALRESFEETNGMLVSDIMPLTYKEIMPERKKHDKLLTSLIKESEFLPYYVERYKYLLYIAQIDRKYVETKPSLVFGETELQNGYERTIKWLTVPELYEMQRQGKLYTFSTKKMLDKIVSEISFVADNTM